MTEAHIVEALLGLLSLVIVGLIFATLIVFDERHSKRARHRRRIALARDREIFRARTRLYDMALAIFSRDFEASGHAEREITRRHHTADLLNARLDRGSR